MKGAVITAILLSFSGLSAQADTIVGEWVLGHATLTEKGVAVHPCNANDGVYLTITQSKKITIKVSAVCGPVALPEQKQYLTFDKEGGLYFKQKIVGEFDKKTLYYNVTQRIDGFSINSNLNVSLVDENTVSVTATYSFGPQVMTVSGVLRRKGAL